MNKETERNISVHHP